MIRTRYKKVLLVAPEVFPGQLIAGYTHVKHLSSVANIFPGIFEFSPDLVIFDYDWMPADVEKSVRRMRANNFYKKIKICCFKTKPNHQTDSLLKVLGVDQFIYKADLQKAQKNETVSSAVHSLLNALMANLVASVSN